MKNMVIPLIHQRQIALIRCAKQGRPHPDVFRRRRIISPLPLTKGRGLWQAAFIATTLFACKNVVCQVYNHKE